MKRKNMHPETIKTPGDGPLRYLLTAYLFGNISEDGRKEVESHLESSPETRAELEELRATLALVEDALVDPDDESGKYSFEARRLERVLATKPRASWLGSRRLLAAAALLLVGCVAMFLVLPSFQGARRRAIEVASAPRTERMMAKSESALRDHRNPIVRRELKENRPRSAGTLSNKRMAAPGKGGRLQVGVGAAGERSATHLYSAVKDADGMGHIIDGPPQDNELAQEKKHFITRSYDHNGDFGADYRELADAKKAQPKRKASKMLAQKPTPESERPRHLLGGEFPFDDNLSDRATLGRRGRSRQAQAPEAQKEADEPLLRGNTELRQAFERPQRVEGFAGLAPPDAEPKGTLRSGEKNDKLARRDSPDARYRAKVEYGAKADGFSAFADVANEPAASPAEAQPPAVAENFGLLKQGQDRWAGRIVDGFQTGGYVRGDVLEEAGGYDNQNRAGSLAAGAPPVALDDLARKDSSSSGVDTGAVAEQEEDLLAYRYYNAIDPKLSWKQFQARQIDIPPPAVGDEGLGQEGFRARYGVHPFVDTSRDKLSTFAMDVDTASFTRARALLMQGKLPPQEDVRVEEFVNYFKQDYPADPKTAFSVFSDGGPAPFGDGVELLKVTVKARELRPGERKGVILTFCLDTSGSMILDNRLELVRSALTALLDSLGPDDRVGVVAYNDQAYLALPHAPAREKERILGALETLVPAGGSNVEAGLELAYQLADDVFEPRAMNRVVLCSDGVATAGARGPEEILKKIKVYAQRGVYLSSVGFGRQRYDDKMMERLANEGNGRYDFVSNVSEARRIFQANLPAMLQVLAQDAKIQVEFNPDVVSHYRLLGYENRDIKDTQFRDDTVDAGEVGPGTTVTALYEVQSHARAHGPLGRVFVRFRDPTTRNVDELNFPLVPGVLVPEATATSDLFRFIACAAETAELLRGSYWARNGSYTKIMKVLMGLSPEFRSTPEWSELVTVVRQAQAITFQNLLRQ